MKKSKNILGRVKLETLIKVKRNEKLNYFVYNIEEQTKHWSTKLSNVILYIKSFSSLIVYKGHKLTASKIKLY